MKGKFMLIGVAALMTVACSPSISKTTKNVNEERDAHIIVELSGSVNRDEKSILSEQNRVLSYIRHEVTNNIDVSARYVNAINGFVMDVNAKYVTQIRNVPGVKEVNYNATHCIQTTESDLARKEAIILDNTMENISKGTMNVPATTNEGEGTLIAILDTGFMIHASYTDDNEVEYTDAYHAAFTALDSGVQVKYTQESIKAKIDAASNFNGKYDATHSTYFNSKVPFYYDYGGDMVKTGDDWPDRVVNPDYDVFDVYNDHGNHVASIAAGNDPHYKGIAPKAQLALMKVFTPIVYKGSDGNFTSSTGATDVAILSAFEDCISLGVDVVNMSLGSTLNDFTESDIVLHAVENLQNSGVYCAIAAGNDGKDVFYNSAYEYWTTDMVEGGILGGYASSAATIVGSAQPDRLYYETALKVGSNVVAFKDQIYTRGTIEYQNEHYFIDLLELPGHADGHFEWVKIPGWGESKDYAELVTSSENKVAGKIAIINRGETTFASKIALAQGNGAIAVGIIDNDPTATDFNFNMDLGGYQPTIPVVSILFRDKEVFDIADHTCVLYKDVIESNPTARQIADSSSDGPVYDLSMKPEIVTPGDSVLGAIYAQGPESYEYYSGTSMATPNYAGVYALMLSENLTDPEWKPLITDRLMSAANPIKDKYGTNFESVRKQGAGLVNVDAALKTDVFFDGSADPTNLLGKAKIELKNNDQIKNGVVDLKFTTINVSPDVLTYETELYVYRPKLGQLDAERYGEKFDGVDLMSNNDELIEVVEGTLAVQPGANAAEVSYSLSAETKAFLDEKFPYGTYIEGYLVLKNSLIAPSQISIPYLGFYGDYSAGIPVEPFKFERNNDLVYPSDLVDSLGSKWAAKNGMDYGSDWIIGNWSDMSAIGLDDYITNDKTLRDLYDSNSRNVVPACTNPYTGNYETQDIYMGNNGYSNTMIIQQFVMRSVETNTITIKNKASGEVILVDHMFDSFFGAVEDEQGNDIQWPLYKSFIDTTYWSAGYLAHRAYTIIPLYEYEYNEDTKKYTIGDEYPEGEYEMKFEYVMASGATYTKTYTLHIDNSAPQITSITNMQKDGKDILRIRYEEIKMSYVAINGYKFPVEEDEKGYYIDVEKANYQETNKIFIRGYDFASSISNVLLKPNDEHNLSVGAKSLTNAFSFEDNLTKIGEDSFSLQFSFVKSKKEQVLNEDLTVTINMSTFANCDLSKDITVKSVDKTGKESAVAAILDAETGTLRFSFYAQDKVVVTYGAKAVEPVDPGDSSSPDGSGNEGKKKGCGGSIAATSLLLAVMALSGVAIVLVKRKED